MITKIIDDLSIVYDALDTFVGRVAGRAKTTEEKELLLLVKTFKDKLETEQKTNINWRVEYDTQVEVK